MNLADWLNRLADPGMTVAAVAVTLFVVGYTVLAPWWKTSAGQSMWTFRTASVLLLWGMVATGAASAHPLSNIVFLLVEFFYVISSVQGLILLWRAQVGPPPES